MRLLFVHERFGAFGGAEANILAAAGELRRRGHSVALAHGPQTGKSEAEWEAAFHPRLEMLPGSGAQGIEAAISAFRPDLIFLHKLAEPQALRALAGCGRPVVRMVHDHDMYCMRGYKYNTLSRRICGRSASLYCIFPCGASVGRDPARRFGLRWISYLAKRREIALNRRFARLIVATGYMRDELIRNGFQTDRISIHAPVPRTGDIADSSNFSPSNRIVYAGQVIRGKGVDVLVESLARVTVPFECVVLGDGSHRPECERLTRRLGLADKIRFAGFVPQARIAEHYREASLAVMSSLWPEPFGATGLEAMRCGLPVVAFDAGGIREWLIDGVNGFLVPWMDRDTYARRVEALLRDKTLARQLGSNARKLAGERFGFATYIDGLEALFRRVAGNLAETPSDPVAALLP